MHALSIRQPYAELILRGMKRIEYRSRPTRRIGQRFYIYASKQWAAGKLLLAGCGPADSRQKAVDGRQIEWAGDVDIGPPSAYRLPPTTAWSHDLAMPRNGPEPWMMELAQLLMFKDLPMGVIVGSAVIEKVIEGPHGFEWHLGDVQRVKKLRKPKGHPQPVWFTPF